jgi:hypothetical protein
MIRVWLVATVVALALLGCQHTTEARADDVEFRLNDAFALAGGQDAVIAGDGLRIRFDAVLEDSRCPAQVECVWTGQARIAVILQALEGPPKTVAFNTNPAPGQNAQTATVGGYVIRLLSLEPYPQTPQDAIPLEEYRATIEVAKSAS